MSHWALNLIGLPWKYGAQGPDEFDCFGFVRFVMRTHYGIEMPFVDAPTSLRACYDLMSQHPERSRWVPVEQPQDGDVTLMARNQFPVHIGVAVVANHTLGILHCFEPAGVVFQTPQGLRATGWGRLTHYRRQQP